MLRTVIVLEKSVMDCHPDRNFSFPKGMRSGVEGPCVSRRLQQSSKCFGKRKGASQKACAKLYLYFQPIRFRGVNPPTFQIYFLRRIMDLAGIGRLRGLDKIPEKIDLCTVFGAKCTEDKIAGQMATDRVGGPFKPSFGLSGAVPSLASPLYLLTLVGRRERRCILIEYSCPHLSHRGWWICSPEQGTIWTQ